ncbi:pyridoxal-phosphate dependent enzyme [Streptomyces sp. NRRL F-4489]|uniref:pyridoxal-phosphate dependent enzyme n=1 Tax=Streptomyces sp. NRRL F-4489 TaxID=1609095 RepID=UPI00099E21A1|nr:pyridoxal-phosphate dependent enzyme [Streptomyces sp. NRRL F-4489]
MTTPAPPAGGSWAERALAALAADAVPTPLRPVPLADLPDLPAIGLYVKDESAQPTGSVKDRLPARLAVADPENSAYFPAWASGCDDYATGMPSRIPGIGRPRTEPGFRAELIDLVVPVPDAASVAAMRWLHRAAGLACGPAAGTALWAACHLAARMRADGRGGIVVALAGDGAEPYRATHLDPGWLAGQGLDPAPYATRLDRFAATGEWNWPGKYGS